MASAGNNGGPSQTNNWESFMSQLLPRLFPAAQTDGESDVQLIGNIESLGLSPGLELPPLQHQSAQVTEKKKRKRNPSSAVTRVPPGKGTKYRCQHCDFGTNSKDGLTHHSHHHTTKAKYQCNRCSYAVDRQGYLKVHETRDHHQQQGLLSDTEADQPEIDAQGEVTDAEELIPAGCPHCNFKSESFVNLTKHLLDAKHEKEVTKKEDPSSLLMPFLTHDRSNTKDKNKQQHQQGLEDDLVRAKVFHCPSCRFWHRSLEPFHVHVVTKHRDNATESAGLVFQCSACTFKANHERKILKHIRKLQPADEAHAFARSTVRQPLPSDRYASQYKMARVPKRVRSGFLPSKKTSKDADNEDETGNPFDSIPAEERKCTRRIESALEKMRLSLQRVEEARNAQLEKVQQRAKLLQMEEAVRLSSAELAKLGELKEELEDRKKDVNDRRMQAELEFRTAECDALRAQLQVVDAADGKDRAFAIRVHEDKKEAARLKELAFKGMESDLLAVQLEIQELDNKLASAKESSVSAGQLLDIMRGEMQQSGKPSKEAMAVMKELCASAEAHVRSYLTEQEKLIGFRYLDTMEDLKKRETDLLTRLDQYDL